VQVPAYRGQRRIRVLGYERAQPRVVEGGYDIAGVLADQAMERGKAAQGATEQARSCG
jgi:hypothetical protein